MMFSASFIQARVLSEPRQPVLVPRVHFENGTSFVLCYDVQLTDLGGTFCTFYSRMIEHPTKHGAVVGSTPPE